MHGKTTPIHHQCRGIFYSLPSPFLATRYHSLGVEVDSLPTCLELTACTAENEVMGLKHRHLEIESVQFHPESVATEHGVLLLKNFVDKVRLKVKTI